MAQVRDDLKAQMKGDPKNPRRGSGEPATVEPVDGQEGGKNKKKKKRKSRHGATTGSRIEMRKDDNTKNNTSNSKNQQETTTTTATTTTAATTTTKAPNSEKIVTSVSKITASKIENAQGDIVIYNTLFGSGKQETKAGKKKKGKVGEGETHMAVTKRESPSPPEAVAVSDAAHVEETATNSSATKEKEGKEKAEQPDNTLSL